MGSIVFYEGQPIETLSQEELVIALRQVSKTIPFSATGTMKMSKSEAINLGLIDQECREK